MNYKHGGRHTPTYTVWCNMKARCHNEKSTRYADYGGRGITVCQRWCDSFADFLADMGERPDGLTIERIDNDRGYEPGNCRWASKTEQNRNRRDTRLLTANGRTLSMVEWAEASGIQMRTIWMRLRYGWSESDAVTVPVVKKRLGNPRTKRYHSGQGAAA